MAAGDEEGWNDGGDDKVLQPALETMKLIAALGDESMAVVRVSRVTRHVVRLPRVHGALNSPGKHALHGFPKRQEWRRYSPHQI